MEEETGDSKSSNEKTMESLQAWLAILTVADHENNSSPKKNQMEDRISTNIYLCHLVSLRGRSYATIFSRSPPKRKRSCYTLAATSRRTPKEAAPQNTKSPIGCSRWGILELNLLVTTTNG